MKSKKLKVPPAESCENQTAFRQVERLYKRRCDGQDHSNVIDFVNLHHNTPENQALIEYDDVEIDSTELNEIFGKVNSSLFNIDDINDDINDKTTLRIARLKDVPGFVYISNPFNNSQQKVMIQQCLSEYTKLPNVSNLDTHYVLPIDSLWDRYARFRRGEILDSDQDAWIQLRKESGSRDQVGYPDENNDNNNSSNNSSTNNSSSNICSKACTCKHCHPEYYTVPEKPFIIESTDGKTPVVYVDPPTTPATTIKPLPVDKIVKKWRWVTLGYQYHWASREYHFERRYTMPELVTDISKKVVDRTEKWTGFSGKAYKPEAGIVNFYQMKDTLMGHVDRSEKVEGVPLVSLSLGSTAIFLIGGPDRSTKPHAMFLRSGDFVIMSGACRKSFHGVPRILEDTCPEFLRSSSNNDEWELFGEFIEQARINVNVRQVF